jgi:hypothetical protein
MEGKDHISMMRGWGQKQISRRSRGGGLTSGFDGVDKVGQHVIFDEADVIGGRMGMREMVTMDIEAKAVVAERGRLGYRMEGVVVVVVQLGSRVSQGKHERLGGGG